MRGGLLLLVRRRGGGGGRVAFDGFLAFEVGGCGWRRFFWFLVFLFYALLVFGLLGMIVVPFVAPSSHDSQFSSHDSDLRLPFTPSFVFGGLTRLDT